MSDRVVVFLRAPRIGAVKTRLAAQVGAEAALSIYRQLVERTLSAITGRPNVELRFTPDDGLTDVLPWKRQEWRLRPQGEGSLGDRLHRACEEAFAEPAARVVIIGSDCPRIVAQDLDDAFAALSGADVALGPATDGGYWLIGLRRPCPRLFQGISWSTGEVLRQTLERAREATLRVALLRELSDVDTAADWERYRNRIEPTVTRGFMS